ncbi:MAG: AAA family ATPase [Planctomycetota bacterium]
MKENSLTKGLETALLKNPANHPLRLLLASEYLKENLLDRAIKHIQFVLEQDRNSVPALLALARVKESQGSRSEAIVILERALALQPKNADIHYLLSQLKLEEGLQEEARSHYEAAKRLNPEIFDPLLDTLPATIPQVTETPEETEPRKKFDSPEESEWDPEEVSFQPEASSLHFSDVVGMELLKRDVRLKMSYPLKNKSLYASFHQKIGGSLFLYGPPGCGKTYFCEAVAGEQPTIPFYRLHLEDVLDSYTGLSEKNLVDLFEQAKKDSPSILLLDQIDAIAGTKKDQFIPQTLFIKLLQEIEQDRNQGLLILGTSNQPWTLEESLLSASRFERIYFIPPPDLKTRQQFLEMLLRAKPQKGLLCLDLAKKTSWYTYAEIKVLVERSSEYAIEESLEAQQIISITMEHFEQALAEIFPISAKPWLKEAAEYAEKHPEFYKALLAYLEIHQLD